jgi:hypothetical protein
MSTLITTMRRGTATDLARNEVPPAFVEWAER